MKKIKTDRMDCSTQICSKNIKEQNNRQKLKCRYNRNISGPPPRLCHKDCSERRKSVLIVPSLNAQKCHKKVLCSKVKASAGKQMDIYRQKSLFRNSSIVIGILLGLMCCGSLHAKGKTAILILQFICKMIFSDILRDWWHQYWFSIYCHMEYTTSRCKIEYLYIRLNLKSYLAKR